MDAATMRQGAALTYALLSGDASARGPLSDWLEETGQQEAAIMLRQPWARLAPWYRGPGHISREAITGCEIIAPDGCCVATFKVR